jgi:DNA-directed RNA polymerase specialized sigma24 family protein
MKKIIEKIATEKIVENIIANVSKDVTDEDLADLAQDVYLTLMEKDEELLYGIYERGQINYYLTRIILNNINSKTSPFYYRYRRYKRQEVQIDDTAEKGEEPDYI